MRLPTLSALLVLVGCGGPDPQAEVRAQWAADSARYAGLDCGMVPLDETDDCRRVNGVLRRRERGGRQPQPLNWTPEERAAFRAELDSLSGLSDTAR